MELLRQLRPSLTEMDSRQCVDLIRSIRESRRQSKKIIKAQKRERKQRVVAVEDLFASLTKDDKQQFLDLLLKQMTGGK